MRVNHAGATCHQSPSTSIPAWYILEMMGEQICSISFCLSSSSSTSASWLLSSHSMASSTAFSMLFLSSSLILLATCSHHLVLRHSTNHAGMLKGGQLHRVTGKECVNMISKHTGDDAICLLSSTRTCVTTRLHCRLLYTFKPEVFTRRREGREEVPYLLVPHSVLHAVGVLLQAVPGINLLLLCIVLRLVLLSIVDHAVNVLLGQPALLIGDGDLLLLACSNGHRSFSVLVDASKIVQQGQLRAHAFDQLASRGFASS